MVVSVYVVRDRRAIEIIKNNNLDGFKTFLEDHPALEIDKEAFWTKEEAIAFCSGLKYGIDEKTGCAPFPLRAWELPDTWFMKLINRPDNLEQIKTDIRKREELFSRKSYIVYGLTNLDLGSAYVEDKLEDFRDMVMNGEGGRIYKYICKTLKNAEFHEHHLTLNDGAITISDYVEGSEPFVKLLEEQKCYILMDDETQEEEE